MIRIKTLSWPIVSAILLTLGGGHSNAGIAFSLSTYKTFRQDKTGATKLLGGNFDVFFRDGNVTFVGGCASPYYIPPRPDSVFCPGGTTGYLTLPDLQLGRFNAGPYFWITDVVPALIIEPRQPDLCVLKAAPASKLKRPASGFIDESYGVYYNLHDRNSVVESVITRYTFGRTYSSSQWTKFNDEIVPGVYHYSFPRLHNPILRVPVPATIYPMVDGYQSKNGIDTGVRFFTDQNRWTKKGFMELSYIKPNVIRWTGFTPNDVYPGVDTLHFALRFISDPNNPNSPVITRDPVTGDSPASLFPGFVANGGDPRVAFVNPFTTSFTLPPILKSGSKAIAELSLDREFQTGGVTYDFSGRKFQVPVEVVNRYSDYADVRFRGAKGLTNALDDFDKDGSNNLTEWILGSRAEDEFSVPENPVPINHALTDNYFYYWFYFYYDYYKPQWFGFIVDKVQRNVPAVRYTLQRSTDKGATWSTFDTDANWRVTNTPEGYLVESKIFKEITTYPYYNYIQPPGTEGDIYRVKITLKK